jgi:hypothetical protein
MRRGLHRLGLLMITAGLGMLRWAGLVYAGQDPFAAIANKRAQRALGQQFEHRVEAYRAAPQARCDIDKLRRGDSVTLQMPYATFTHRVTSRRIVLATFLQALDSRGRDVTMAMLPSTVGLSVPGEWSLSAGTAIA